MMSIERRVLLSLLEMTPEGAVSRDLASKDARVPLQVGDDMLQKISSEGLVQLKGKEVEASPSQRVRIAIRAINLGGDFERVCRALRWDEFETITATAFLANSFTIKKRFRFKNAGRRWEIDVIGCKEPTIACVDCKHWRRGFGKSAAMRVVEAQIERTEALATTHSLYQKLALNNWRKTILIPIILTLTCSPLKFHKDTPIVPILQLQDFLNELPAHVDTMKHFLVNPQEHTTESPIETQKIDSFDKAFK